MPDARTTPIDCPHCERQVAGSAGLASHIRSMHPEQVAFVAPTDPPRSEDTNGELVWEDPPAKGGAERSLNKIRPLVPQLRRHPGRWARLIVLPKKSSANTAKTKAGYVDAWSDIEFTARTNDDGTSSLYGRYVEEADAGHVGLDTVGRLRTLGRDTRDGE